MQKTMFLLLLSILSTPLIAQYKGYKNKHVGVNTVNKAFPNSW
jgi:hypothetical protein